MAGDPSTMFGQLPDMGQGPMSGYLRGIAANYGMSQQDQSLQQQNIANQQAQLGLDTAQKNVPLQDAQRQVALGQAGLDQGDMNSGLTGDLQRSNKDTAIISNMTKMSDAKLHTLNNQFDFYSSADTIMQNVKDPAQIQATWESIKKYGDSVGVNGLPDYYSTQVGAGIHAKAQAAEPMQKFAKAAQLQREKLTSEQGIATEHNAMELSKASIMASGGMAKSLMLMKPDEKIQFIINQKMENGTPLSTDDLDKASQVEYEKIKADPKVNAIRSQASTDFIRGNDEDRKKLNETVKLPKSNTNVTDYSDAVVEQKAKAQVNDALKARYGGAEVRVGNNITTVNDYLTKAKGRVEGAAPVQQKQQPTQPKATQGPPPGMSQEIYDKAIKLPGSTPAKVASDWAAYQAKKQMQAPPVPAAPPMPPQQQPPMIPQQGQQPIYGD